MKIIEKRIKDIPNDGRKNPNRKQRISKYRQIIEDFILTNYKCVEIMVNNKLEYNTTSVNISRLIKYNDRYRLVITLCMRKGRLFLIRKDMEAIENVHR